MTTYAFATAPGQAASLWATMEDLPKGARRYSVINGAWDFTVDRAGVATMGIDGSRIDPAMVWCGEVPREHARHYNDALKWIREQVK